MSKIDKISRKLNDEYRDDLKVFVKEKFGIEIETEFNLFEMTLYSKRVDGKKFTKPQADAISCFEAGYVYAMNKVKP